VKKVYKLKGVIMLSKFLKKIKELPGKFIQGFFKWFIEYSGIITIIAIFCFVIVLGIAAQRGMRKERKITSLSSSFEISEKEFKLLQGDISDLKKRVGEIEWVIDERVGEVVDSLNNSPINDILPHEDFVNVPPM